MSDHETTEPDSFDADALRRRGIDLHGASDTELVEIVSYLRTLGVDLDEMADTDLTVLAGPRLIRPGAQGERTIVTAGVDPEFAIRAAIALGFGPHDDPGGLTPKEVEAIVFFDSLRPLFAGDELFSLLRVLGSSMSRVARSLVSALRVNYEAPILDGSGGLLEVAHAYSSLIEHQLPAFLDASSTVLRRHLAMVAGRPTTWVVDDGRSATLEVATVGFVDLVGFTSFTEQADAADFIEALSAFETQVNDTVVAQGGTLVKLLGDEAMFVAPTPSAGINIARRLAQLPLATPGPSSVRIGLAAGEVIAVGGDYYGTIVNIASRIQELAEPDCILVNQGVADEAHAVVRFEPLGPLPVRGIADPVDVFRLCDSQ